MDILQVVKEREMYRGLFQDRRIDRKTILQIVEAARWAPSGHNSQPWEFIIVDDKKIMSELVSIAIEDSSGDLKTRQDLREWVQIWWRWFRWSDEDLENAGDGIYPRKMSRDVWEEMTKTVSIKELRGKLLEMLSPTRGTAKIAQSPCLIIVLLNMDRKIPDFSRSIMELTSMGAAVHNLRLAAYSLGLATHELSLLCDLPQTRQKSMERLGIPNQYRIVSTMRVGYPGTPSTGVRTHVRRPVEKLVHWNLFIRG